MAVIDTPIQRAESALAGWLSGNQKHILAGSLAAFVGHPAYNTGTLRAGLHRFAFLPGASDGKNSSASQPHDDDEGLYPDGHRRQTFRVPVQPGASRSS